MTAPSRPDDMRILNRKRVLSAIRAARIASRTDIAATTNLSAATVSAITSDLLAEGVVAEGVLDASSPDSTQSKPSGGRGRPKVGLKLNAAVATVCSIYIQYNLLAVVLTDYAGDALLERHFPIDMHDASADHTRELLLTAVRQCLQEGDVEERSLVKISVGFQGVSDVEHRRVLWTPICREEDLPLAQWLEDAFGATTEVTNDCDMIALALKWRFPQIYGENFAAILLAHGVGMGLCLRNDVVNGTRSSGMEFGHMAYMPGGALCRCGNHGCIEAYAGDYAIIRAAGPADSTEGPDQVIGPAQMAEVAKACDEGDPRALRAAKMAGAALGTGLASLYALVDPFPLIFVGRGTLLIDHMKPALLEALESAPGSRPHHPVSIACFDDETDLVLAGCTIHALDLHDDDLAQRKHPSYSVMVTPEVSAEQENEQARGEAAVP